MRTHTSKRVRHGFTLIEILIVVVILGILAAIVIPQFTDASVAASRSNLASQLQTMRSQIELYNVQNPATPFDASTAVGPFWTPLIEGRYIPSEPKNPLVATGVDPTLVEAAAPTVASAWVWVQATPGDAWTLNLYAADPLNATGLIPFWFDPDNDGVPD